MRYVATPAYTRIAIYLSALAGGEAGDFLKHDRQSADGMGDQAYREGDEH